MNEHQTIVQSNNFIVLAKYNKITQAESGYQSEDALEREFIADLHAQGYEFLANLTKPEQLLENARIQLQALNNMQFLDSEWQRFVIDYLDKPSDNLIEKTRKIQDDYIHDFVFDDGHIQNIYLVDKKIISRNKLQVIKQFEQEGTNANRYDVTILVNGLPLVHVELKKRGVSIREAFNQIHRYSKESFNTEGSLFKYIQLFVISNGTDSRYFANTTKRDKNSYDFTMNWAKEDNSIIKDLKDFTATFFQRNTLLNILLTYSVFDVGNNLLVMRPYQIAATERLLWRIQSTHVAKIWNKPESGGYIWHTTGSGKTLTSFKAARLATEFDYIDKVFFVVDRKDLDYQTMKEYKRFSPNSVNGSTSTDGLKANIEKTDNKIIVTTIQKLNNLMKSETDLPIYHKPVVFIFDECHRSQFGEAQKNLKKYFKKFCQFGFTGTPIFPENSLGGDTTATVFGTQLHTYVITDAIRDEKVLKFKVDYNDVRPLFKDAENEQDTNKLSAEENKQSLLHPNRINEITQYILDNFRQKTHRLQVGGKGFNAIFAVSSIDAAKLYYQEFKVLQQDSRSPLKIATAFSYGANEEQNAIGDIVDEGFEPSALDASSKEFLRIAIDDYNTMFKTNWGIDSRGFQDYYRDLTERVKSQDVDLLIVVGMFLTGFDAPMLNTLFVDKNLRFHGLIQAYSRTNRIYNATKTFGNIVTFRNLEDVTVAAIKLFGDENTKNILLEKSFKEYMEGFTDIASGKERRGYINIVNDLQKRFPETDKVVKEEDKKEFAKVFGEYLQVENILQNFDEFSALKAMQKIDLDNHKAVEEFQAKHHVTNDQLEDLSQVGVPTERAIQDYRSTYNDIREWLRREKDAKNKEESSVVWDDVVFEVDLLKSQEINLDYILELIFDKNKSKMNKDSLIDEVRRMIRASIDNRAKESLIVEFINQTNLDSITDKVGIIDEFFKFAQEQQKIEATQLISEFKLNPESSCRYINTSLQREYASENGTELNSILPKMSPLNPNFLKIKQAVFEGVASFVEKFKGVGGKL